MDVTSVGREPVMGAHCRLRPLCQFVLGCSANQPVVSSQFRLNIGPLRNDFSLQSVSKINGSEGGDVTFQKSVSQTAGLEPSDYNNYGGCGELDMVAVKQKEEDSFNSPQRRTRVLQRESDSPSQAPRQGRQDPTWDEDDLQTDSVLEGVEGDYAPAPVTLSNVQLRRPQSGGHAGQPAAAASGHLSASGHSRQHPPAVLSPGQHAAGVLSPGQSAAGVLLPGQHAAGVLSPGQRAAGVLSPGQRAAGVLSPVQRAAGVPPEHQASVLLQQSVSAHSQHSDDDQPESAQPGDGRGEEEGAVGGNPHTLEALGVEVTPPKRRDMAQLSQRLGTFRTWPGPRLCQSLAEAGFYYKGRCSLGWSLWVGFEREHRLGGTVVTVSTSTAEGPGCAP